MEEISLSSEVKILFDDYLRLVISALSGDKVALVDLGKNIVKSPLMIKNLIFYDNFQKFLKGMEYDKKTQIKFLEFLNSGDKNDKAKRILLTIDSIDSDFKVHCILNLTKSVSYGFISSRCYSKLCKLVTDLITEDLIYLKEIIPVGNVKEELVDEYERNGLMYLDNLRHYVFSKLAFYLDKYALSYGTERYNYSEEDERKYPPKYQPQAIHYQNEEPNSSKNEDVWISKTCN